jgi:hypothetical protein
MRLPGIACSGRLEQDDFGFFLGGSTMFLASGDYHALSRTEIDDALSKFDTKSSLPNQKEFVFRFVEMPGKRSFHLHDLYFPSLCAAITFGRQRSAKRERRD